MIGQNKIPSRHVRNISPAPSTFGMLAKVKELERQGKRVIDMGIGEPDMDTPEPIKEAAMRALREGKTHYSPSAGIPELREAIAEYETERKGVQVTPKEVLVMPGGKPVLLYMLLALVDEGDEVIYFEPAWGSYKAMIEMMLAKPVPIQTSEAEGWRINPSELAKRISPKTRIVIINSPNNPTSAVVSLRELEEIAEIIREHPNLFVLSDEVYSTLIYEGSHHHSILSLPGMKERTVLMESFSKVFAMTGWRLGYGIFPEFMIKDVINLVSNTLSCANTFVQYAGVVALKEALHEMERLRAVFQKRRDLIVKLLREIPGITFVEPRGAFYALVNIRKTGMRSEEFSDYLLSEYGVATVPGTSFGPAGEGYIRFSFATGTENIEEGITRFGEAVKRLSA
ncbi:MAG: pyridoxal phosphate-dependent aminotransferase [candidate division WOR-3 bacterium]